MATSARLRDVSSDANDQIRELRSQVDQLMRERVSPMVSDAAGRAQDYARQATDFSRDQAEAFSNQVREMPIAAVLVAAAAGYLLGRLALMRLVRLGKIAAQAEALRLRRFARRQAMRGVYGAVAAVFAIALLAALHVAGGFALAPLVGPVWASLIVAGVDLVIAGVFGAIAAANSPDRIEREALRVREEARAQMAEAAVMTTLVGPVLRRAGLGLLDRAVRGRRRA